MSSNKRPHRKAQSNQTKTPVSCHTALKAHTGDPLVDAGITQLLQAEHLDPHNAALLHSMLQLQQLIDHANELEHMVKRAQAAIKVLFDLHNGVPMEESVAQAALQEFITCLPLLESKEHWAHELRATVAHRVQNGTLVPKYFAHDPVVQELLQLSVQELEKYFDKFDEVLSLMRKLAQGLKDFQM